MSDGLSELKIDVDADQFRRVVETMGKVIDAHHEGKLKILMGVPTPEDLSIWRHLSPSDQRKFAAIFERGLRNESLARSKQLQSKTSE